MSWQGRGVPTASRRPAHPVGVGVLDLGELDLDQPLPTERLLGLELPFWDGALGTALGTDDAPPRIPAAGIEMHPAQVLAHEELPPRLVEPEFPVQKVLALR